MRVVAIICRGVRVVAVIICRGEADQVGMPCKETKVFLGILSATLQVSLLAGGEGLKGGSVVVDGGGEGMVAIISRRGQGLRPSYDAVNASNICYVT